MFLRCPEQFRNRYIEGLKIPPSAAMVQSKVWHGAVEANYRQKIKTGQDLPLNDMQEIYAADFDVALKAEEIAFQPDENPGKVKDEGVAITTIHHKLIAPTVRPALVEEKFVISLGDDFPYDLVGVWDLVDQDGFIADNKAYSKTPNQSDVDKDIQLGIYSLGYRVSQNKIEKGLRLDTIVKNKQPKAVQIATTRTNDDCRFILRLIEQVAKVIQSGVFYPNPNGWHCSPERCGYWSRCIGKYK
ncbi:MAG: hypothetical protein KCHDKBKB_01071 [Elusimicrobia bacterium]|nr:hypothetical protein [Elusimicrobiota bacterium]